MKISVRPLAATLIVLAVLVANAVDGDPASAAPRNTIAGSGTYLVGRDFNAGIYRSTGNTSCYWQRAKNAGGSLSSIIANDIGDGQRLVTVRATDKVFKTSRCRTWVRVLTPALKTKSRKTTIPGNGAYLVGSDFLPGTYRSSGNTQSCYWERARSADGTSAGIIANEISTGQLIAEISATDAVFKTSRCATWRRVG
ncbi:hypothetical protein [Actinoplanes friuliensis]|uniref:Uncharacterized protein n=1 Tax=Actinoplanes friuliensis DSM 7358 TaxID=1246995 RepID=U5VV21_9ACTN|nr:hypothetical protein [Actinoplanes friuliensis]AGZ40642.1 hypothetical protein AFR_11765 [Actinoplanes friuliensis DSM 7358]